MIINNTSLIKEEMNKQFEEKYSAIINSKLSDFLKYDRITRLRKCCNYFEKCTFEEFILAKTKTLELLDRHNVDNAMKYRALSREYKSIKLPRKGTKNSAGYDFFISEDITINPGEKYMYITGIIVYMQDDMELSILARSSSDAVIYQGEGVVDADFSNSTKEINGKIYRTGIMRIPFYNNKNKIITIKSGTYEMQGLFREYFDVINPEILKEDRNGGFGHTNTK